MMSPTNRQVTKMPVNTRNSLVRVSKPTDGRQLSVASTDFKVRAQRHIRSDSDESKCHARGTESDILVDGSLDYPDAILEKFDVIIASIHSRMKMDSTAMTERLVRA